VKQDFILEIGCENIPSGYLDETLSQLERLVGSFLETERIPHDCLYVAGTPNRIVVRIAGMAAKQEGTEVRFVGPPASAALNPKGGYTKAGEGFARSQGIPVSKLVTVKTDKGEYVAVVKKIKGKSAPSLIREALPGLVSSVRFPKVMKWDSSGQRFARPIRWILALHGEKVLRLKIGYLSSGRKTRLSPFFEDGIDVASPRDYFQLLEKHKILLDGGKRGARVRAMARKKAESNGGRLVEDDELVHIVANLLESPVVLVGRFDPSFLDLPREVVVTALKSHQRYFSVEDDNGALMPLFIAFADGLRGNRVEVARGYERVLQARLADAEFYYREDTERPISELAQQLDRIVWLEKLGTLAGKAARIERLAVFLWEEAGLGGGELGERLGRAARLAKADLASEMVKDGKEFTKLQGYIGREYAIASGEEREVADAIFEHYLPRFSGDRLPGTDTGAILSIADKLDTIVGCFAIGLEPSGSQDPYALRRQALGMLRILIERRIAVSVVRLIEESVRFYGEAAAGNGLEWGGDGAEVIGRVAAFIESRLSGMLRDEGFDHDIVQALLSAPWEYPFAVREMAGKMQRMRRDGQLLPFIRAMKRIINILPKGRKRPVLRPEGRSVLEALSSKDGGRLGFSSALFGDESERALLEEVSKAASILLKAMSNNKLDQVFDVMNNLVPVIDRYFDDVLVNCEEENIRSNRHSFLANLRTAFGLFCDYSAVAGE
jgi:glycyl-tRNA synthetase beta chain